MLHVQVVLLVIVQGFSVPLLANSRNDVHVQVVFLVTYSCLLMRDIVVLFVLILLCYRGMHGVCVFVFCYWRRNTGNSLSVCVCLLEADSKLASLYFYH